MLNCTFQSKNKKSLKTFFKFLKNCLKKNNFKIKLSSKKLKKTTLLKSPHVHKKAQEHFELKLFKKKILIQNVNNFKKVLVIFKKSLKFSFYDLKLKLNLILVKKNFSSFFVPLKLFYFNQKNKNYNDFYFEKITKTFIFFKLLNFTGNSVFIKKCLNSSVG